MLTSVIDTYVNISWAAVVVPFTSAYSTFWVGVGAIALDLMIAVFVTSLLRARMRPATWRAVHWLAYLCWPIALAHTFGMGTDAGEDWVIVAGRRLRPRRRCCAWRGVSAQSSRQSSARRAHASVPGMPPKHLALSGPGPFGAASWLAPARPLPATGRYRLLGHPTDLAAHVATLGPAAAPGRGIPGLARGLRLGRSRRRAWPAGAAPGSPPRSSSPWRMRRAAAAPSSSTPWRASRRATRTSCCSSDRPTWCSTARSFWPPPAAHGDVAVCVPAGRDHVAAAVDHGR